VRPIQIEGFEKYHINEEGVVVNTETGKVLRTDLNRTGYKRVTLSSEGKTLRIFVHKLVALTYVEGYAECLVVNHIDGNKINNHKDNLEWTTASNNRKHAFENKLCKRPNSRLSDRKVHEICELISEGTPAKIVRVLAEITKHEYEGIYRRRYYVDISRQYKW
jgi:hypothetical protein